MGAMTEYEDCATTRRRLGRAAATSSPVRRAVIQNVMTNFVGPRLMAQTVGIHPLLVFAALLVGARVAGLWGVFLALPIAGILNVFARYALEVASGRRARTEASRMLSEREQRRARR